MNYVTDCRASAAGSRRGGGSGGGSRSGSGSRSGGGSGRLSADSWPCCCLYEILRAFYLNLGLCVCTTRRVAPYLIRDFNCGYRLIGIFISAGRLARRSVGRSQLAYLCSLARGDWNRLCARLAVIKLREKSCFFLFLFLPPRYCRFYRVDVRY